MINNSKSKELLTFTARRSRKTQLPPPCEVIDRVQSLTALGVVINDRLSATDHVNAVLSSCSGLLYALRILRTHGMPTSSLHDVFRATIVAKILYGSPAWSGLCSAADRSRLNALLRRCKRYNYCSNDFPAIEDLFFDADDTLFKRFVYYPAHVLHPILPAKSEQPYNHARKATQLL